MVNGDTDDGMNGDATRSAAMPPHPNPSPAEGRGEESAIGVTAPATVMAARRGMEPADGFGRDRRCTLLAGVRIERGTRDDWLALAPLHYRSHHAGAVTDIRITYHGKKAEGGGAVHCGLRIEDCGLDGNGPAVDAAQRFHSLGGNTDDPLGAKTGPEPTPQTSLIHNPQSTILNPISRGRDRLQPLAAVAGCATGRRAAGTGQGGMGRVAPGHS